MTGGWIEQANEAAAGEALLDLAERVGLKSRKCGARRKFDCPDGCDTSDKAYQTRKAGRLHCPRCKGTWGAVGLVALAELGAVPAKGDVDGWRELRIRCAVHGLCDPPADEGPDGFAAIRAMQAQSAREARQRAEARERASAAARAVFDEQRVSRGFSEATRRTPPRTRVRYARETRALTKPLARAAGQAGLAVEARYLGFAKWSRGGVLAWPISDANGVIRSAALRRTDGETFDGRKTLYLSNAVVGSTDTWPALVSADGRERVQCRAFGSIPDAVREASDAAPIIMVEGETDTEAMRALYCAQRMPGHVIGAAGAGQLGNIARAIRLHAGLMGRPLPRVICIPDRDDNPSKRTPAWDAMCDVRRELPDAEHVDITDIRSADGELVGDVSDLLKSREGVRELVLRLSTSRRWIDARPRRALEGYLPDLELAEHRGEVLCLRASMGTGKTRQAARLAEQARAGGGVVLAVAPLRSLSRSMATRLDLALYQDARGAISNSAAICINSVCRYNGPPPALLIIDEIEQVFDSTALGTVPHAPDRNNPGQAISIDVHAQLYALVRRTLAAGGTVVAADALLSDETERQLGQWAHGVGSVRVIEFLKPSGGRVLMCNSPEDAHARITAAVVAGRRVGVMTDSKEDARRLHGRLIDAGVPESALRRYDGDTAEDGRADLANVRQAWAPETGVRVVICSPVVGSGIDAGPMDVVFGLFRGTVDVAKARQMLGRFRGTSEFVVWAAKTAAGHSDTAPTAYATIRAEFEGRFRATDAAARLYAPARYQQRRNRAALSEHDERHLHTCIIAEQATRLRRQSYRRQLVATLEAAGYIIDTPAPMPKAARATEREAWAAAGEGARAREVAGIEAATPLSEVELARVDREGYRTAADAYRAKRARLQRDHGEVSAELIEADRGRGRMRVAGNRAARAALAGEPDGLKALAAADAASLRSNATASARDGLRRAHAERALIECVLGKHGADTVFAPPGSSSQTPEWSADSVDVAALRDALTDSGAGRQYGPNERTALGYTPRELKSPTMVCKAFGELLNRWGITRDRRRESRAEARAAGRSSPGWRYRIIPEDLEQWRRWVAPFHARARGVRCNGLDATAPTWDAAVNSAGDWWIRPGSYTAPKRARRPVELDAYGRRVQRVGVCKTPPIVENNRGSTTAEAC